MALQSMSGTVLRRGAIPEMMCMYAMKRGNMTCRKNQGQRISYFQSAYQDVSDLYIQYTYESSDKNRKG